MVNKRLAIQARGVSKRFGPRAAVSEVTLEIPAGCAFGLLGPNGAGKTTLMRLMGGLARLDSGDLRVLGGRPYGREAPATLAAVGASIDGPRFHLHLSGRQNLAVIAAARGKAAGQRIDASLAAVGLSGRAGERVGRYSMGMRQRLGIARCLLGDPELLILDEPTNGLDPSGIAETRAMIRDFVAEGRTVVVSSHRLDDIERSCDLVGIMQDGRLVSQTAVSDLRRRMMRVFVRCADPARAAGLLARLPQVTRCLIDDSGVSVFIAGDSWPVTDAEATVSRACLEAGIHVEAVTSAPASLEDMFFLTTQPAGGSW